MVVVPLVNPANSLSAKPTAARKQSNDWLSYAAGGALLAGGLLLLNGKRRAGLLTATTGAALAMLDQQDTVGAWWLALPGLIEDTEHMLNKVEGVLNNIDSQRARIRSLVKKGPSPVSPSPISSERTPAI